MIIGPNLLKLSDCKIDFAALISQKEGAVKDTLTVLPIPSDKRTPEAIEDLTTPSKKGPVAVTPKCRGYSNSSLKARLAIIVDDTSGLFKETIMLKKFSFSKRWI
jgi:hypothetical protein